ncbi:hypothetical protein LTR10_015002 [Elasticomyces elasticus]|nr:hypothetical protein LTR10_015002 [Elasticomyces elasticus]KAK4964578.1 hypothetical protein LTR42_012876 [Elasticomyces elasticus]
MRTSLQQRLGQEFTYDELLRDLRGTGKSVAPARTRMGDIDKEVRKLIDEQLRDYRFGSIKSHDTFARELNQSFKYVGCRIEERRNKLSKKRKRSKELDGDRVEAILSHEVNPDGKIIYEVKWLGWEGSTFEARENITIRFYLTIYAPIGSRTAYYGNGTFDNSRLYYENVRQLRLHVEVYGEEGVDAVLLRLTPILRACEKLAKVELVIHGETDDNEVVMPLIDGVADVLKRMGEGTEKQVQLRIDRTG